MLGGGASPTQRGVAARAAEAAEVSLVDEVPIRCRTCSPRRSLPGGGRRTCRSSRSPPPRRAARSSCSGGATRHRQVRAVPPVLDAPGDRGGVHPRRARQLHHLRHLLPDREGDRRRPRATTSPAPSAAIARFVTLHEHNLAQKRRGDRQPLPHPRRPQGRRQGQGDGGHRLAGSTPCGTSGRSTSTSPSTASATSACSSRSPAQSTTTVRRGPSRRMNGFPESQTAEPVRHRRLADPRRGREVPDRLRPAEALRHVRRQDPHGPRRRPDAVPPEPHAPRQGPARSCSTSATTPRTSRSRSSRGTCDTVAPPTDPNLLYDTHAELGPFDVLRGDEIETMVGLLLDRPGARTTSGSTPSCSRPSTGSTPSTRTPGRVPRRAHPVRPDLRVPLAGRVVHRRQARTRLPVLPAPARSSSERDSVGGVDLGDAVELTHLRMEKSWAGDASLDVDDDGEVITIYGGGGRTVPPEEVPLSEVIERINERFGDGHHPTPTGSSSTQVDEDRRRRRARADPGRRQRLRARSRSASTTIWTVEAASTG